MTDGPSVWHIAREYAGLAEAGGVKDVVRGLAEAQVRAGWKPTVVLPLYGFLSQSLRSGAAAAAFVLSVPDQDRGSALFDETVRVHVSTLEGVRILLVDSPRYASAKDVYTYTAADESENHWKTRGSGHWDAHQKNVILQRAALETALALGESPDVVHCHDGHAAFLPALLREEPRFAAALRETRAVVTIHNAGTGYHQEVWSAEFARLLTGLSPAVIKRGLLGTSVDPLLLAGDYASLTTVSERYAEELLAETDGSLSGGLGRAFRERGVALRGITNGIDPRPWDPRRPGGPGLPSSFDPQRGDLEGKKECRAALLRRVGLPEGAQGPLYAFVGRLTGQKGIDVLFHALKGLLGAAEERRFIIIGKGDRNMEAMLGSLASESPHAGRVAFQPVYDQELAALVYAGSDFFLVPSAYEPCGLTDFIAQVRGSIPVVHHVGGLVKVRDGETGFSYVDHSPAALARAVERTSRLFREDPGLLDRIRRRAFEEIYSRHTWDRVFAESYLPLYRGAARERVWTGR